MNKSRPILYLLLGYPGAGKTTTAKIISQLSGAEHLSSDSTRLDLFKNPTFNQEEHRKLYKKLDELAERFLREGKNVIYDANLNRYQHRQEKYDICRKTGAQPVLLWVRTPRQLAKQRATHVNRQPLWPDNETSEAMFERIANVIEEPHVNEPYIQIDGTKVSPEYISKQLDLI
ncbi:ATP-binding protein [Candidatus Saccharibacteria bacterium]|nr:ATP-binding protein [Candidatus Saccharibacteria bacterium]MBI3338333.1 ATP-binding protein [Candidatus Saccharibacteria bacterium]